MSTLKIYGASDDLIELEGAIHDEINAYGLTEEDATFLAVSDGTMLQVFYSEGGVWRFLPITIGAHTRFNKTEGTEGDDNYSDVIELTNQEPFKWALLGDKRAKA